MQAAPTSIDVQDFQFKLHCRIKVFENENVETFKYCCNLVATASRFGLVFIGLSTSELLVIHTKTIEGFELKDGDLTECPTRRITIASPPSFISVNCDCTKVAVVVTCDGCANVVFYDVASFLSKDVVVSCSARLSATPGVRASDISWNPVMPEIFTACKDDGTLGLYELSNSGISINELPAESGATSMCWSPKGKQIAIGSWDGKITQYKPNLKAARVIDSPPLESGTAVIALQWISNYQFIGVYNRVGEEGENNACLIVVNAPKTGATTFVNYQDDLYYSSGVARMPQFYTLLESHWNVLLLAYSNCMEIGLMGSEGEKWTQWILDDSTRAELPLTPKKQETFPVGLAIDVAAINPVPWGESSLPPAPFLYMLSTHGTLSCWRVVNVRTGVGSICSPPENLPDIGGLAQFTKAQTPQTIPVQQPPQYVTFANPMPSLPTSVATISSILSQNSAPKLTPTKPPKFGALIKPETQSATLATGPSALLSKQPTFSQPFGTTQLQTPQLHLGTTTFSQKQPALKVFEPQSALETPPVTKPADDEKPGVTASSSLLNVNEARAVQEETDALFSKMIFEEVGMLDAEVKILLHKAQSLSVHLGTDEEGIKLVTDAESLQNFLKEVTETTNGQAAEVHALKNGLIGNWALFEDARLRHVQSRDAEMGRQLRTQPLDPASKRNLAEIEHLQYYLESQIIQANAVMDDQWEAFQDSCRSTIKTKVPTMEAIYQTMVRESVILQKHKYVLKDLSRRIQAQRTKGTSTILPLLVSHENPDKLEAELQRLTLEPKNASEATYKRVQHSQKKLTSDKLNNLRNLLGNRKVSVVAVSKPLPSATPAGLVATPKAKPVGAKLSALPQPLTSLMGATLSPIPNMKQRVPVPKQLDFIQSTPLVTNQQKTNKPDDSKAAAADIVKPTFSFASVAVSTESSFGLNIASTQTKPVVMVSSGGSAFVPTTHLQTALKQPDSTKPSAFQFSPATTAESKGFQPLFSTSTLAFHTTTISSASSFSVPTTNLFAFTAKPPESPIISLKRTPATTDLSSSSNSNAFSAAAAAFSMGKTLSSPTITATRPSETLVTKSTSSPVPATLPFNFGTAFDTLATKTSPMVSASTTVSTMFSAAKPAQATKPALLELSKSPTAATTASIFSKEAPISGSSIFGTSILNMRQSTTSRVSTAASGFGKASTGSLFGQTVPATTSTTGPTFGQTTSIVSTTTDVSSSGSIFGKPLSSISNTGSIFGQPTSLVSTTSTTTMGSILGQSPSVAVGSTATAGSIFAQATTTVAGSPVASTTGSIFGQAPSVTTSSTGSIFGKTATSTITTQSIFGQTTSIVSTTTPSSAAAPVSTVVGKTVSSTGTSRSIFGQVSSLATSSSTDAAGSVFGGKSASITTGSIFGQTSPVVSTPIATTAPIFGQTSSPATTNNSAALGSVFDKPVSSATTTPSIFGQTVSTPTTSALPIASSPVGTPVATTGGIFASATPATTSNSFFGQPVSSTTGFNQVASTSTGTTSSSLFAQPTFGQPASTTTVFGQPASTFTVSTSRSLFGQPAGIASTSGSIFGKAASSFVNSGNLLGKPATVSSASPSIFGSPTPATTQVFGSSQATSPTFGSPAPATSAASGSVFGAPATSSAFGVFGNPTTSASAFGIASPTPVFGSPTSSSAFGATGTSNASSGFGAKPAFGSGGSIFGSPPAFGGSTGFGSTSPSASAFGGGQNAFGNTSSASSFNFASAASNIPASSSGFGVGQSNFGFGGLNVGSSSGFGTTTSSEQNPFAPKTSFGTSGSLFATPASTASSSIFGGGSSTAFGSSSPGFGASVFGQASGFGNQSSMGGPFSGNTGSNQSVAQSGFGAFGQSPKPSGFGAAPVFGGSPTAGFGSTPSFGGNSAFGGASQFGSPGKVFGSSEASGGFGGTTQQNATFANLANQNSIGFGALAQQSQTSQASSPPSFSGGSSFSSWR